tara:strand:- start:137 stop:616 length:480 start_codon:yes stop_codon:yes gene_type:complete
MLQSTDAKDKPLINANYLAHDLDLRTLVEGMKMARSIGHGKALDEVRGCEIEFEGIHCPRPFSDEYHEEVLRKYGFTLYHPTSTVRMGPPGYPADEMLRVRGVQGLRVADASVMPVLPSANTMAPTVMIGERCAAMVLEEATRSLPNKQIDTKSMMAAL